VDRYSEKRADRLRLFRERLAHTITVTTAAAHSRTLNGLPDPSDQRDLAIGSLVDRLLSAYIDAMEEQEISSHS
jgi:hypothetical protein